MKIFASLSIRNKLIVCFLTVMILTTVLISVALLKVHSNYIEDYLKQSYALVGRLVSEECSIAMDFKNYDEVGQILNKSNVIDDIENAQIYTTEGKMVANYSKANTLHEEHKVSIKQDAYIDGEYLIVTEPIVAKNQILGVVYMKISTNSHTLLEFRFLKTLLIVLLAVIAVVIVVVVLLHKAVASPITKLSETFKDITTNQKFNIKPEIPEGNDEITELYKQFGIMIEAIASREQERDAAKSSEQEMNQIFSKVNEAAFDATLLIDKDLKIKYINNSAEKMFGYKNSDAVGSTFKNLIIPTVNHEWFDSEVTKLRSTGKCKFTEKPFEAKCKTANDEEFEAEISVIQINNEQARGSVITIRDISARKKYEQELIEAKQKAEESDKLKSAFLANMSHEIRTPMNSIIGFSELLAKPGSFDKHKDKYLEFIINSGKSLLNLINDIIDISKIEAGQLKVKPRKVALNPIMNEIYLSHYQINDMKNKPFELRMKKAVDTDDFNIETDPFRFKQILNNLIGNAMKFTEKGYIEFGYKFNTPEQLLFYVKDTGVGMPQDKLDVIFKRFGQIEQKDDKNQSGTGLGLTISKKLAELLGGDMWVESVENEGSTFFFTLPYDSELNTADEYGASQTDGDNSMEGKTILVAEDEDMNIAYMKEVLADTKANVLWAKNGEEAVNITKENPSIDLILMDIKMPIMNGYDATKKIREFNKDVVIIAQTAYALTGEKEKTIAAGCNYYITKPIEIQVLMNTLQGFLNRKK